MRNHMNNNGTSHHVLSYDLTGPHPATCGAGYVYGLIGAYYVERAGENIPFVRGLKRKTAVEVAKAIKSIFAEIRCILGETLSWRPTVTLAESSPITRWRRISRIRAYGKPRRQDTIQKAMEGQKDS